MCYCKTSNFNLYQIDRMIHDIEHCLKLTVEHNPGGLSSPEDQSCLLEEEADQPGNLDFFLPHNHGVRHRTKNIM